jgi:hypothetical protein
MTAAAPVASPAPPQVLLSLCVSSNCRPSCANMKRPPPRRHAKVSIMSASCCVSPNSNSSRAHPYSGECVAAEGSLSKTGREKVVSWLKSLENHGPGSARRPDGEIRKPMALGRVGCLGPTVLKHCATLARAFIRDDIAREGRRFAAPPTRRGACPAEQLLTWLNFQPIGGAFPNRAESSPPSLSARDYRHSSHTTETGHSVLVGPHLIAFILSCEFITSESFELIKQFINMGTFKRRIERWFLEKGDNFHRVILQLAHRGSNLTFEGVLADDNHGADGIRFQMLPHQLVGIASGG